MINTLHRLRWLALASAALASPLPIIIDTDIGDDFDDSWALATGACRGLFFERRETSTKWFC